MKRCVLLEPAAETLSNESAIPPLIFQLPPSEGRKRLNQAQDTPVYTYPASTTKLYFNTRMWGTVNLFYIKPTNLTDTPNVIFYIHGGGWVFGNLHTHYKLVAELAARTNSVVFFPEYTLSPEAKYPTALEQCYDILCSLPAIAKKYHWTMNFDTLAVAGDSVGGNMATVMTLLAKYRGGPYIHKQLLFYPVTNACFQTDSYQEFATDYYLYREGMMWFWDQYTTYKKERNEITASPLQATIEQLRDLPSAMILNGEADVLRDEGEAYASKLLEAGVSVTAIRYKAIIHDFVMLHALDQTNATRAAMNSSTAWLRC